jgi:hypothetical protein
MGTSIGIAIPVCIKTTEQLLQLCRALESISVQTILPDSVVLSVELASSPIDSILSGFEKLPLKVIHNYSTVGIAENSNNAARNLNTDYIHFLHQDDLIISREFIGNLHSLLTRSEPPWVLLQGRTELGETGFAIYDQYTVLGFNRVGGPSSLVVRASQFSEFNSAYTMMVDVVLFEELFRRNGTPVVLDGIQIEYGNPSTRVSRNLPPQIICSEILKIKRHFDLEPEFVISLVRNRALDIHHRFLVLSSLQDEFDWSFLLKSRLLFRLKWDYMIQRGFKYFLRE